MPSRRRLNLDDRNGTVRASAATACCDLDRHRAQNSGASTTPAVAVPLPAMLMRAYAQRGTGLPRSVSSPRAPGTVASGNGCERVVTFIKFAYSSTRRHRLGDAGRYQPSACSDRFDRAPASRSSRAHRDRTAAHPHEIAAAGVPATYKPGCACAGRTDRARCKLALLLTGNRSRNKKTRNHPGHAVRNPFAPAQPGGVP